MCWSNIAVSHFHVLLIPISYCKLDILLLSSKVTIQILRTYQFSATCRFVAIFSVIVMYRRFSLDLSSTLHYMLQLLAAHSYNITLSHMDTVLNKQAQGSNCPIIHLCATHILLLYKTHKYLGAAFPIPLYQLPTEAHRLGQTYSSTLVPCEVVHILFHSRLITSALSRS